MEETIRVPLKDVGRISVDVNKFGHGTETLFSGMSEVFGSLGVVSLPEYRPASEAAASVQQDKSQTQAQANTKVVNKDKAEAESGEAVAGQANVPGDDVTTQKKSEVVTEPTATQPPAPEVSEDTSIAISLDDITGVIVAKIKQKRGNSEVIQKLLTAYKVGKVSELKPGQYEAFMTDLAQI